MHALMSVAHGLRYIEMCWHLPVKIVDGLFEC